MQKGSHRMKTKLEKIAELRDKKKTAQLVKLTKDSDEEVRVEAFRALSTIGDRLSTETCLKAMHDKSPAVQLAVADVFERIGDTHIAEVMQHQMIGNVTDLFMP